MVNTSAVFSLLKVSKKIAVIIFFFHQYACAQKSENFEKDNILKKYACKNNAHYDSSSFYLISKKESKNSLYKFIKNIDTNYVVVDFFNSTDFERSKNITTVYTVNNAWKLTTSFKNLSNKNADKTKHVFIVRGNNVDVIISLLTAKKQINILSIDQLSASIVIQCTTALLFKEIIPLKEILFADIYYSPHNEINVLGYNSSYNGVNLLAYNIPAANGNNIVVGIKENKMDISDIDLYKRVLASPIASNKIDNHATTVATIIGGAGNSFYNGKGIAVACKFFPSSYSNLFMDDTAILNKNKVSVQNHSYGTIVQQFYGAEALSYDSHMWENKYFVHVFSAGNNGLSFASDGKYANLQNYANLTGNFKMAKNIISVGAISNDGNVSSESSAGPTYDGRMAPQLAAYGPNGTSDAAAMVSGTIAVMQQVYADSNSSLLPPASLIKSILYNTADDIYNMGIDYKTGYGLVNSFNAIKTIQQKKYDTGYLLPNQIWTKNIIVPNKAAQLKVTLSWTDIASALNNDKGLMIVRDLEVKELSTGNIFKPWVLNTAPSIDSLQKMPLRKRDSLNTAEQVSITPPDSGMYQIIVKGITVINYPLAFSISYKTDSLNTFSFTNPVQSSDVNPKENKNLTVKWDTFVADSAATGNLYISYNAGINWEILQQLQKLNSKKYNWLIKDTSCIARFKMETSFGSFVSNDVVISKVVMPNVDFFCVDSFRLSWNKHVFAKNYEIFTQTDSAYFKPVFVTTDTFVAIKRFPNTELVYAILPILNNSVTAVRSIAINVSQQAAQCFYNSIYSNFLTNSSLKLTIDLSIPEYVDSIYFEKFLQGGVWLQYEEGLKVKGIQTDYTINVLNLAKGTTFLRGRIKLKNGTLLYTEAISVITSGKNNLLLYPNPIRRNDLLHCIIKKELPIPCKLQIIDLLGRLIIQYSSVPSEIDVSKLPSGILVYKLLSNNNTILESGKLLISD